MHYQAQSHYCPKMYTFCIKINNGINGFIGRDKVNLCSAFVKLLNLVI